MNPDSRYVKDGVKRVLDLMRETFGDNYTYFDDELIDIPENSLPCIMVTETSGEIGPDATTTDKITETMDIIIVFNVKDDLGADENTELTGNKIRRMVKGQDPNTNYPYEYIPQSVMYALRTNVTLDDAVVSSRVTTSFGPDIRGESLHTMEGRITLTIEREAAVPVRS